MSSDLVKRAISEVIRTIEFCRENQDEIDNIYSEVCDIISKEMENKLQSIGGSKKTRILEWWVIYSLEKYAWQRKTVP